jgi:sensor domain CHASE-containing protein
MWTGLFVILALLVVAAIAAAWAAKHPTKVQEEEQALKDKAEQVAKDIGLGTKDDKS